MSPRSRCAAYCIAFAFIGVLLFWPLRAHAARKLATHVGITAYVPDDFACGEQVGVRIVSKKRGVFEGDRRALQRLIGGVRAILGFECSKIRDIQLIGQVAGSVVWEGVVSENNDWVVVEVFSAPKKPVTREVKNPEKGRGGSGERKPTEPDTTPGRAAEMMKSLVTDTQRFHDPSSEHSGANVFP